MQGKYFKKIKTNRLNLELEAMIMTTDLYLRCSMSLATLKCLINWFTYSFEKESFLRPVRNIPEVEESSSSEEKSKENDDENDGLKSIPENLTNPFVLVFE